MNDANADADDPDAQNDSQKPNDDQKAYEQRVINTQMIVSPNQAPKTSNNKGLRSSIYNPMCILAINNRRNAYNHGIHKFDEYLLQMNPKTNVNISQPQSTMASLCDVKITDDSRLYKVIYKANSTHITVQNLSTKSEKKLIQHSIQIKNKR